MVAAGLEDQGQDRSTLETLARGLAHEIRTPLNVIAIDVRMMRELIEQSEDPTREKLDKISQRLQRQVGHIATILERFLDFARPGELELEVVTVQSVLAGVADTISQEAEGKGIEVRVFAPDDLEVKIDPSFNNIRLGAWQGKAKAYIAEEYPDDWEMWKKNPTKLLIPDGESLGEVRERAWGRLKHLVQQEHSRESIAIVTHRSVIKTLLGALVGLDTGYFWTFYVDTASYSTIIYKEDGQFYIHQLNMGCGVPSSSAEEF